MIIFFALCNLKKKLINYIFYKKYIIDKKYILPTRSRTLSVELRS